MENRKDKEAIEQYAFNGSYIGQDVKLIKGKTHFLSWQNLHTSDPLLLKSLKNISDEDAEIVAKMALGVSKLSQNISVTNTVQKCFGFSFWLNYEKEFAIYFFSFYSPTLVCLTRTTADNEYLHNVQKIVDYLRSRGYLLPFRNYSIEQILSMGWAKINTK